MPAVVVNFTDISATIAGTVIEVDANKEQRSGYYYFGPDYMEEFGGGAFDLKKGVRLPSEIEELPEEEREVLRKELFQEEQEEEADEPEE